MKDENKELGILIPSSKSVGRSGGKLPLYQVLGLDLPDIISESEAIQKIKFLLPQLMKQGVTVSNSGSKIVGNIDCLNLGNRCKGLRTLYHLKSDRVIFLNKEILLEQETPEKETNNDFGFTLE